MLRSGEGVSYSLVSLLNVVIEMSKWSRKLGGRGLFILAAGSLTGQAEACDGPGCVLGTRVVASSWRPWLPAAGSQRPAGSGTDLGLGRGAVTC